MKIPKDPEFLKAVLESVPYDRYAAFHEIMINVEKKYSSRRYDILHSLRFLRRECEVHEVPVYDEGRCVRYYVRIKHIQWYKNLQRTLSREMKDKLTKHIGIDTPTMEEAGVVNA